jgi:hypothetical protein
MWGCWYGVWGQPAVDSYSAGCPDKTACHTINVVRRYAFSFLGGWVCYVGWDLGVYGVLCGLGSCCLW